MSHLLSVLGWTLAALAASFLFWIFVAYAALRGVKWGVCSVCGAVVTVWSANLVFGFLPGWVTVLLIGQSVVGGATLLRDVLLVPRAPTMTPRRYQTLAQLTWFGLILGGTFALGLVALVWGWG